MSTSTFGKMSPTGADELEFPPQLLERMQIYWAKVCRAFTDVRGNVQNPVPRKEFHKLIRYIGCDISDADFEKISETFDFNRDGRVDYRAILKVVEGKIFPKDTGGGISLSMTPTTFKPERPSGRLKKFKDLSASWNNIYHQSEDPYNGGRPMLSSVMQGKFYYEAPKPISPREFPRTTMRPSVNPSMDEVLHQPLVKSLVQGEYYLARSPARALTARSPRDKTDFVAFNRKTQKDYSRTARPSRPFTAPASRPRLCSPGAGSPLCKRDWVPPPSFNVFRPFQQQIPDRKSRRLQTEALISARAQTAPANPSSSPRHRDLLQGPTASDPARPADRTGAHLKAQAQRPITAYQPRAQAGPGTPQAQIRIRRAASGVSASGQDQVEPGPGASGSPWTLPVTPRAEPQTPRSFSYSRAGAFTPRVEKGALEEATAYARRRPSERRTPRPQIAHCPYPVSAPQTPHAEKQDAKAQR